MPTSSLEPTGLSLDDFHLLLESSGKRCEPQPRGNGAAVAGGLDVHRGGAAPAGGKRRSPESHEARIKSARIMIVDDLPVNITVVRRLLQKAGYQNFITTTEAAQALELMRQQRPDVVLLDVMMPVVSGLEILRAVRSDAQLRHLPVLILTAACDAETRHRAFELGATDFLSKPVDPHELAPRLRNTLLVKAHHDHLETYSEQLEAEVRKRTAELEASRQELILCLARAAEYRDGDTGHHIVRVGRYAGLIAAELGFDRGYVELIEQAAQLHDVGKIGVPDAILLKPERLDPDEFAIIQKHCSFGKQILQPLSDMEWERLKRHTLLGSQIMDVDSSPVIRLAARIAQTHHERWDGTGYPLGLAGEDIPIEGRITAVADVYDALSSKRPYKQPFPRETCFAILEEGRGKHFDPRVLDAFFARSDEIVRVQIEYADNC